jgi:hypothetical protein
MLASCACACVCSYNQEGVALLRPLAPGEGTWPELLEAAAQKRAAEASAEAALAAATQVRVGCVRRAAVIARASLTSFLRAVVVCCLHSSCRARLEQHPRPASSTAQMAVCHQSCQHLQGQQQLLPLSARSSCQQQLQSLRPQHHWWCCSTAPGLQAPARRRHCSAAATVFLL